LRHAHPLVLHDEAPWTVYLAATHHKTVRLGGKTGRNATCANRFGRGCRSGIGIDQKV